MEVIKILLTLKIVLLCAARLGDCLKCYRCSHKKGSADFPPGILPSTMADNVQCDDPFNITGNKVSITTCDGHCAKKIYKYEDTKFYERDCISSCEEISGEKLEGFDNVKLDQSCCDEDKCNSAESRTLHVYFLFTCLFIVLIPFRFL